MEILCPSKINLDLKIEGIREDSYHNISSKMQTIAFYDVIKIEKIKQGIILEGNSKDIPYNEKNIVYKVLDLFLKETKLDIGFKVYITKNIWKEAGLAGGSTDGAGALYGANKISGNILKEDKIHEIMAKIGSDLNFCYEGGLQIATSRGEKLKKLPYKSFNVNLVKPKNISISTPFAYKKYDELKTKSTFLNDLEYALINKYKEFQYLHDLGYQMTGSGSAYFKIGKCDINFDTDKFLVLKNIKTTEFGVIEI